MVASGSPRALRVRCGYVYRDVSWMYLNVFHLLRKIHSEYTQDRYITTSVSQDTESTMYLRQPERKPRTKRAAQTSSRRLESSFQGTVPGLWPQLRVRCPVGTVGDLVSTMIRYGHWHRYRYRYRYLVRNLEERGINYEEPHGLPLPLRRRRFGPDADTCESRSATHSTSRRIMHAAGARTR